MEIINSATDAEMAAGKIVLELSAGHVSSQNLQSPCLYVDFVAHHGAILSVLIQ